MSLRRRVSDHGLSLNSEPARLVSCYDEGSMSRVRRAHLQHPAAFFGSAPRIR